MRILNGTVEVNRGDGLTDELLEGCIGVVLQDVFCCIIGGDGVMVEETVVDGGMCCPVEVDAESFVVVKCTACDGEIGVVLADGIDTRVGVVGK